MGAWNKYPMACTIFPSDFCSMQPTFHGTQKIFQAIFCGTPKNFQAIFVACIQNTMDLKNFSGRRPPATWGQAPNIPSEIGSVLGGCKKIFRALLGGGTLGFPGDFCWARPILPGDLEGRAKFSGRHWKMYLQKFLPFSPGTKRFRCFAF